MLVQGSCLARPIKTTAADNFIPSAVKQPGRQFPPMNAQHRVLTGIYAPQARLVLPGKSGVKYELVKDAHCVWTDESTPLDEDFHYYPLNIDGASVPVPGTLYF